MNEQPISVNLDAENRPCTYVRPNLAGTCDITTPRLDLRKFKERDAQSVLEWSQDELILTYFNGNSLNSVEEAKNVIASWRVQYENDDFLVWCIQEAETKSAIGKISANVDIDGSCADIEYSIMSRKRGQGYAVEALSHIIEYLHGIGVHRIQAKINTRNLSSTRVAEKAGMELEGICRDALIDRHGMFYDVAIFAHLSDT